MPFLAYYFGVEELQPLEIEAEFDSPLQGQKVEDI